MCKLLKRNPSIELKKLRTIVHADFRVVRSYYVLRYNEVRISESPQYASFFFNSVPWKTVTDTNDQGYEVRISESPQYASFFFNSVPRNTVTDTNDQGYEVRISESPQHASFFFNSVPRKTVTNTND